jgi:hypothetical protein
VARGVSSTRFALARPAKSSTCSTVSRASAASLIVPSPRQLEAPLTAQLRLSSVTGTCAEAGSRAEADATLRTPA